MFVITGKNVWDDIDPSSESFIKNYLMQYPEVCLNYEIQNSIACTFFVHGFVF